MVIFALFTIRIAVDRQARHQLVSLPAFGIIRETSCSSHREGLFVFHEAVYMDQILTGDCLRHLASLPEAIVDLAFADPPFNIGYEYDVYNDRQTRGDYLAWTEHWLAGGAARPEAGRLLLRRHRRRICRRAEGSPRRPAA